MNNTGSNKTGRAAASDGASSQASAAAAPASRPAAAAPTKYRIVKDGWGSRSNFQASYLLGSMEIPPFRILHSPISPENKLNLQERHMD